MTEGEIDLTKEKSYVRDKKIFWKTVYALLTLALAFLIAGIVMQVVFHQTKAPLWLGLIVALPLAIPLELWNFTDPDTLWRVMSFQDRFLMVCFGFAIGVGSILLYGIALFTHPNFGIKDFFVPGIVIGGLIFGAGVGLAGYFPGTIWIALGQGRRDAIYAVFGGLIGAFTWSAIFGNVRGFFWNTLNFGPITWASVFGITAKIGIFTVSIVFGVILILVFLLLPRYPAAKIRNSCGAHILGYNKKTVQFSAVVSEDLEKYPNSNKYVTKIINESSVENARMTIPLGLAFTITAVAVIILHQIFGESTTYSWIGAQISYMVNPVWAASNSYFQLFGGLHIINGIPVNRPFSEIGWEPFTDTSSFLGGLISATLISRRFMGFKKQVPKIWIHSHNPKLRPLGSFVGAFMVLFGARMANGCASGHILSGDIQMAISSFVFMIFVLLGSWLVLRFFMHMKINSWGYTR